MSRSMMSQLMDGSKQLSPEAAALAAHIVGSDPYREAAEAMVKNCKDARKAERLTQAFHLPRSIGGAVMLVIFVIGGLFGTADVSAKSINPGLTDYTLRQMWCRIVRAFVLMARGTIGATGKPGTRTCCQAGTGHCGLSW